MKKIVAVVLLFVMLLALPAAAVTRANGHTIVYVMSRRRSHA